MTIVRQPILRQTHAGRTIGVVGDVYRFLATGDETDGKHALLEALVPSGGGPPPHIHSPTGHFAGGSALPSGLELGRGRTKGLCHPSGVVERQMIRFRALTHSATLFGPCGA